MTEHYDISAVIAQKMQLEAVTPAHGTLAVLCQSVKHLVEIPPYVMAYRYYGAVYKAYAVASAEGVKFHEHDHVEEHTGHEFHEPVIRYGIGKLLVKVLKNIEYVVVLEVAERTEMVIYEY